MKHLQQPKPRIDLNSLLQRFATSAIDISDGLSADLNHICKASGLAAQLSLDAIPVHPLVKQYMGEKALDFSLQGGDDYELCFTSRATSLDALQETLKTEGLTCYPIGMMVEGRGLCGVDKTGAVRTLEPKGYCHFKSEKK
jgi:thiamine-monophosphate kinase